MNENMNNAQEVEFLSPRSRNNVVKISCYSNYVSRNSGDKIFRMQIIIGNDIARQLKWKDKDRLQIKIDDNTLFINKIDNSNKNNEHYKIFKGYILMQVPRSYSFILNIRSCIQSNNTKIRTVPHEIISVDGVQFLKIVCEDDRED